MIRFARNIFLLSILFSLSALLIESKASYSSFSGQDQVDNIDSTKEYNANFKLRKEPKVATGAIKDPEGVQLLNPTNFKSDVQYDPENREYVIENKIGGLHYRYPWSMSLKEYRKYELNRSVQDYWREQATGRAAGGQRGLRSSFNIGGETFDKIFGGNTINIVPKGQAELIFGVNIATTDNPQVSPKLRTLTSFNFDMRIQMNVEGSIGERVKLGISYNTDAMFEFENKTNLSYAGDEDEIIKKIELGDVSLPLSGSLISGSQSLFGVKTELQFGKLFVSTVLSQQRSESKSISIQGGAQVSDFEINADDYDANKHFFLSQHFAENYDNALSNLPLLQSGVVIEKMEVWVTNKNSNFIENRDIVAFMDLGENKEGYLQRNRDSVNVNVYNSEVPDNKVNNIYSSVIANNDIREYGKISSMLKSMKYVEGRDFEKVESARKLTPEREYTYNKELGFISLNTSLNADEIVAVAYEYKYRGQTYKVGEFSSDIPKSTLVLKLIKGTNLSPRYAKAWNLMMKNIYSINAYQVSREDFTLDVLYRYDKKGIDIAYLPEPTVLEKKQLISVMNLDNTNSQLDPYPDGRFDFIEGRTILADNGRIIFPMKEPFGRTLFKRIENIDNTLDSLKITPYLYQELYDSTQTKARLVAEKNKYKIKGTYKSSMSSEIYLNAMNVPKGSVKVTQGGNLLIENVDYTVDYSLGTVKILNQGLLNSGQKIDISLESQSMFNIMQKTLIGTHLDYRFSENFNLGATILRLNETALTKKVNIGDEPISNIIWGLNGTYRTEWQYLTTLIDKLPLIQTKEVSTLTLSGEFAQLVPGTSKSIDKNGVAYIDDFESSETSISLHHWTEWKLAGTPHSFPEGKLISDFNFSKNRARLAWYHVDPLFVRNDSYTPKHLYNSAQQKSHYVREVYEQEIFPDRYSQNNISTSLQLLNLAFYPNEKGPYNYDTNLDTDGTLKDPETRWGGIMRELTTNDFESANVEYLEFWLMDPFVEDSGINNGELYFNFGNISEDIMRDSRKSFENGLPSSSQLENQLETSIWGKIPVSSSKQPSFGDNNASRKLQDVGLDGVNNVQENEIFEQYVNDLTALNLESSAYQKLINDPSSDDFHYFRGSDYDNDETSILDRYKYYNNMEGNSRTSEQSTESYPTTGTTTPDTEDINGDNTLNENESYYEYKVDIDPLELQIGKNFITDKVTSRVKGNPKDVDWYQFKIPLNQYKSIVGDIDDFKSIRFARIYLKGFSKRVILRFASIDLVRSEWRKYEASLAEAGEGLSAQTPNAGFDVLAVNLEENATKQPVNYILPPGIDRINDPYDQGQRPLNEQSMVLRVDNLGEGDSRSVFKTASLDMRQYKKLKMAIHAEMRNEEPLNNNDLSVFVRFGSDYKNNYYEYEIPLEVTPDGFYNKNSDVDKKKVWPLSNNLELDLEELLELKQKRNDAMRRTNSSVTLQTVFSQSHEVSINNKIKKNKITVCGNPSMSNIRTIMIGVRNPNGNLNPYPNDGLSKSGEIWVNELRLTDFSDFGGWAANARAQLKMADFALISLAGSKSTPGFGSIEQKINERSKEDATQYDATANVELGKFFPEKAQVKVPMFTSYSVTDVRPQYNPFDPDIPLDIALKVLEDNKENDKSEELLKNSRDYSERRSLNFSNVKVNKFSKTPMPYDPGNLSVSWGYNDLYAYNPTIEFNRMKNNRLGLNYLYNLRPKNLRPLSSVGILNNNALSIIRDFNFYYLPSMFSFTSDVNRTVRITQLRNQDFNASKTDNNPQSNNEFVMPISFEENYMWNRMYDLNFDLAQSLRFNFQASVNDRIFEKVEDEKDNSQKIADYNKKQYYNRLLTKERVSVIYKHNFNLNYNVPINKLPLLSWTSATASYGGSYEWNKAPEIKPIKNPENDSLESINLGNTIQNTNNITLSGQANLSTIYSNIDFIRRVTEKPVKSQFGPKKTKDEVYEVEILSMRANRPKTINHRLGTEDVKVIVTDASGALVEGKYDILSDSKVSFTPTADVKNAKVRVEGKVEIKDNILKTIARHTVNMLIGVKNVQLSYTITGATTLPGYKNDINYFGSKKGPIDGLAPGLKFISGIRKTGYFKEFADNELIEKDTNIVSPILYVNGKNINARSSIEPFESLRIELTATHSKTENTEEYFSFSRDLNGKIIDFDHNYMQQKHRVNGNFSMSVISLMSFEKLTSNTNYVSSSFKTFRDSRPEIRDEIIRKRIEKTGEDNSDDSISIGYNESSQWVLIPAFLKTYTTNKNTQLDLFPSYTQMRPNWRASFDGLSKLPIIEEYFTSVTLDHAYSCNYSIGSYISNSDYTFLSKEHDYPSKTNISGTYIPKYEVSSVSITEQFSPLIGVDMSWKNGFTSRFEYRTNRSMNLTLTNNQITDTWGKSYVVGMGYRFAEVPLTFITGQGGQQIKSDLDLKANVSINDEVTMLRKIDENNQEDINAGTQSIAIEFTGDYMLSDKLNFQFFYNQQITNPHLKNRFHQSDIKIGFNLRYSLTE